MKSFLWLIFTGPGGGYGPLAPSLDPLLTFEYINHLIFIVNNGYISEMI